MRGRKAGQLLAIAHSPQGALAFWTTCACHERLAITREDQTSAQAAKRKTHLEVLSGRTIPEVNAVWILCGCEVRGPNGERKQPLTWRKSNLNTVVACRYDLDFLSRPQVPERNFSHVTS